MVKNHNFLIWFVPFHKFNKIVSDCVQIPKYKNLGTCSRNVLSIKIIISDLIPDLFGWADYFFCICYNKDIHLLQTLNWICSSSASLYYFVLWKDIIVLLLQSKYLYYFSIYSHGYILGVVSSTTAVQPILWNLFWTLFFSSRSGLFFLFFFFFRNSQCIFILCILNKSCL